MKKLAVVIFVILLEILELFEFSTLHSNELKNLQQSGKNSDQHSLSFNMRDLSEQKIMLHAIATLPSEHFFFQISIVARTIPLSVLQ